ncbi:VOC family protein [Lentilactobacillus kisonensis]|nr:VOC family protein [Lentilactobacillus kisonensis]KRL21190.1 glyoxalase family protein [Lentilactobacillus kisonensis DSM 19906 = JCM 15041]
MQTHHISLLTRNAKQNVHFYTRVLGMRLIKNTVNQENIKIRHLFYGDYLGTPGTVVTFFVLPLLGHRTDGNHYFNSIKLAIPLGSLDFWKQRLTNLGYETNNIDNGIEFDDPDQVKIKLVTTNELLTDTRIVADNDVPAANQITRLLGTELHVPDPEATARFFHDWLGIPSNQNTVSLDNGQSIELFQSKDPTQRTRFGRGSIDHFALAAPSKEKLLQYWERAKKLNLNTEEYADRGWFKSIYVRDPGDNRIEIATTSPGFSLDEPILKLGNGLGLPPQFENKREEILTYYDEQGVDFHDKDD